MFTRLPESNAQRQRRTGGLAVSAAVHLVLIALAVRATAWSAPPKTVVEPVQMVYRAPEPVPTPSAPAPALPGPRESSPIAAPVAVPQMDLTIVPPTIPELGAMSNLIRGDEFVRPTAGLGEGPSSASPNVSAGGPVEERYVDKPIVLLPGTGAPRYPTTLQSAGVEGDVHARFVVDTLGRVEKGSIEIVESTHDLFAAAVRDALARARFKAAEAGGHRVRQLAEQTFTFRITDKD